jgi:hypothetical protein
MVNSGKTGEILMLGGREERRMEPTEVGWISRIAGLHAERGPPCAAPCAGDAPREVVAGGWDWGWAPPAEAGGPGTWERVVGREAVTEAAACAVARVR